MNLREREDYLNAKYVGLFCCHKTASYGVEIIGHGKDRNENIGSKAGVFKKVIRVEITAGPPCGWTWSARLWFVDGTFTDFSRMREISIKGSEC